MNGNTEQRMGTEPLGRLMLSMALPAVAAQLINVLYNIVDRIYIGHIEGYGDLALTGVGVTFPILMLISAFSAFAGMGGAPLASIALGQQDREKAERILGCSTAMLLLFSTVLIVVFAVFQTPVLLTFGASENTLVYGQQYISIYLAGTYFVQLAVGLNMFITGQGNARVAMLSVLIGAVLNIVLDPIFIFALNMGVRGAAIATVLSQGVSAAWVVHFLRSSKSVIRLKKQFIRLDGGRMRQIAMLGVSPFIMQATESLVVITMNTNLKFYGGDLYVGSMSILMSVMQLIVVPIQGMSQGMQPIISYNYGAANYHRVMACFRRMLAACLTASLLCGLVAITQSRLLASIFTDKEPLIELTAGVMPVYFIGICIFGIQMACQSTFLALGQAVISLLIALLRKVILLVPLAMILPRFLGVMGIYDAEPAADIISVLVTSVIFTIFYYKKLRPLMKSRQTAMEENT